MLTGYKVKVKEEQSFTGLLQRHSQWKIPMTPMEFFLNNQPDAPVIQIILL